MQNLDTNFNYLQYKNTCTVHLVARSFESFIFKILNSMELDRFCCQNIKVEISKRNVFGAKFGDKFGRKTILMKNLERNMKEKFF